MPIVNEITVQWTMQRHTQFAQIWIINISKTSGEVLLVQTWTAKRKLQYTINNSLCKIPHRKEPSCAPRHKLTAIVCEPDDLDFVIVTQHTEQAARTHLEKNGWSLVNTSIWTITSLYIYMVCILWLQACAWAHTHTVRPHTGLNKKISFEIPIKKNNYFLPWCDLAWKH